MPNTFPRRPLQPPYALRPPWIKQSGDLDLWPFDLESGVRVTCDVGYLCANFSLLRPLCSRVRPDVRVRQTSDRQTSEKKHRLMPPHIRGGGIMTVFSKKEKYWTKVCMNYEMIKCSAQKPGWQSNLGINAGIRPSSLLTKHTNAFMCPN